MTSREFAVIINPKSGTGKQKGIEQLLNKIATAKNIGLKIVYTEYAGHACTITAELRDKIDTIIVVGGDGSVNEVGRTLIGSTTSLAIIPTGSGNGLARHLGYSMKPIKAIEQIFNGKKRLIDTGKFEEHVFLATAGLGFDAQIAHSFSRQKKRGFSSYIKTTRKELFNYIPFAYTIRSGDEELNEKAFMLSIANTPQFGNNFTVNPNAIDNDGLFNLTLIKPFPKYKIPVMLNRFFTRSINRSRYFQQSLNNEFFIETPHFYAHVDGEPIVLKTNRIEAKLVPKSLNVIVP